MAALVLWATLACTGLRLSASNVARAKIRMTSDDKPERLDVLKAAVERGFPQGKQIKYGLFTVDVDASARLPEAARAQLREQAAAELAVIDAAERGRRTLVGRVGGAATAALGVALLALQAPPLSRAALVFPIWLFAGYIDSGRTGL